MYKEKEGLRICWVIFSLVVSGISVALFACFKNGVVLRIIGSLSLAAGIFIIMLFIADILGMEF